MLTNRSDKREMEKASLSDIKVLTKEFEYVDFVLRHSNIDSSILRQYQNFPPGWLTIQPPLIPLFMYYANNNDNNFIYQQVGLMGKTGTLQVSVLNFEVSKYN